MYLTKIRLDYCFTKKLRAAIFIERGDQIGNVSLSLDPKELSQAARSALLGAVIRGWDNLQGGWLAVSVEDFVENAAAMNQQALKPLERLEFTIDMGDVDVEPNKDSAKLDAERMLVQAEKAAPAIRAKYDEILVKKKADEAVAREAAIVKFLNRPLRDWLVNEPGKLAVNGSISAGDLLPRGLQELTALDPRIEARAKEAIAEAERLNQAHLADMLSKGESIKAFIREHGSEDMVERFVAGVLPQTELAFLVKLVKHRALESFPAFEPLVDGDFHHEEDCYGNRPKYNSRAVEQGDGGVNAEQWARFKAIEAAAPKDLKVELRKHTAYCEHCEAVTVRYSCRVTADFAGKYYERLYSLDTDAT